MKMQPRICSVNTMKVLSLYQVPDLRDSEWSYACPCGPKDIIRDGEDGLLVENGKTEELAEKINYLIENEQIRKEMGKKARINVQRFAEDVIMQQWIQLFNNLLNGTKQ